MITKTLFTQSQQCLKYAHKVQHKPDSLPEDSLGIKFRKKQGTLVGNFAKKLYPQGIDLASKSDADKLEETKKHKTRILFESSVQHKDLFASADILIPNDDGTHTIIEVKADTKVKPEHIPDISFQKNVFELEGYKIKQCFIAHPNTEYIKQGEINPQEFFQVDDVTGEIIEVFDDIQALRETLKGNEPNVAISPKCKKPYPCPFMKECWAFLPENNVTQLYFDNKLGFELLADGVTEIKDIPEGIEQKGRGKNERVIQIDATKKNICHIEKEEIKKFVDSFIFPIYYFDFETYAPAIPKFDNARAWQRMPFQYSLHIEHEDGTIEHKEFLATDEHDPRPALIQAMINDLGSMGSIVVYNQTFEKSVIKELMRDFPEFEEKGNEFLARIVDLAFPFEKFKYYNPKQMGRYSIKVVLPLFSDLSYKDKKIGNGEEAYCSYEQIVEGCENKDELILALKEYCKLDTLAEVEIVRKLRGI